MVQRKDIIKQASADGERAYKRRDGALLAARNGRTRARSSVNYLSRRSMQDARASCSLAIVKLDSPRRCCSRLDKGRRRFDKARRIGNAPPPIGDKYRCTRIHFPRGKKVHPRAARIRISLMKRGFIASVGRCARARRQRGCI